MTSQPLYQNAFILRRSIVVDFADIINTQPLLKKPLKELEIKCSNAVYICISLYSKIY